MTKHAQWVWEDQGCPEPIRPSTGASHRRSACYQPTLDRIIFFGKGMRAARAGPSSCSSLVRRRNQPGVAGFGTRSEHRPSTLVASMNKTSSRALVCLCLERIADRLKTLRCQIEGALGAQSVIRTTRAERGRQPVGRGFRVLFEPKREKSPILSLTKAVALFSKWKDESAQILAVCESPLQQQQGIITTGLQGKVANVSLNQNIGKKSATVVFETPAGTLSIPIGNCSFAYKEAKQPKPGQGSADSPAASELAVFFPSKDVFVFHKLAGTLLSGEPATNAGSPVRSITMPAAPKMAAAPWPILTRLNSLQDQASYPVPKLRSQLGRVRQDLGRYFSLGKKLRGRKIAGSTS